MVDYYTKKLDNGLEVILSPNKYLHSASISVGFKYGFLNEKNGEEGLSHLIEHMVFEGTNRLSKENFMRFLKASTVYWNGETSLGATSYQFKSFNLSNDRIFEVVSEALFNSIFPEENLKKEKNAVVNEIYGHFGSSTNLEYSILKSYLFRKSAGAFLGGNAKFIKDVPRDVLIDSYSKYYSPNNAVIAIAGNFNKKKVISEVSDTFGKITFKGEEPALNIHTGETKYKEIHMKTSNPYKGQSTILFGIKTPGLEQMYKKREKDRASIMYLRGLISDRTEERLRQETGLAYLANSDIELWAKTGYISAYSKVKTQNLEESKSIIFSEIEKIKEGEISENRLKNSRLRSKQILDDVFDSSLNHSNSMLSAMLVSNRTPVQIYNEFLDLTVDDIRAAAADYLKTDGENNSVLIVSD